MGAFGARRRGTGPALSESEAAQSDIANKLCTNSSPSKVNSGNAGQPRKAKALQSRFKGRPERLWPDANAASPLADPGDELPPPEQMD